MGPAEAVQDHGIAKPLKRCQSARVPTFALDTLPILSALGYFDGRSLHQARPAAALAVGFGGEGPGMPNLTRPVDEVIAEAFRVDVLWADWLVGFDSDTA